MAAVCLDLDVDVAIVHHRILAVGVLPQSAPLRGRGEMGMHAAGPGHPARLFVDCGCCDRNLVNRLSTDRLTCLRVRVCRFDPVCGDNKPRRDCNPARVDHCGPDTFDPIIWLRLVPQGMVRQRNFCGTFKGEQGLIGT